MAADVIKKQAASRRVVSPASNQHGKNGINRQGLAKSMTSYRNK
jgi:hypothetical protein